MKFLFRWAFRLLVLLIVVAVATLLLLDSIVREVLEYRIHSRTGMEARIGRVSVGLFSPVIDVEDFKLYNTAEFGGSPFLDVPELHLEYDRGGLWSRKLHCRLVRVTFNEVALVQSKTGRSNVQALTSTTPAPKTGTTTGGGGGGGHGYHFDGIDTLNVTAYRVTQMTMTDPSRVRTLNLGIRDRVITDIRNGPDLELKLGLVLAERAGLGILQFFPAANSK